MGRQSTSRLRFLILPQVMMALAAGMLLLGAQVVGNLPNPPVRHAASARRRATNSVATFPPFRQRTVSALDTLLGTSPATPLNQVTDTPAAQPPPQSAGPPVTAAVDCNAVPCLALSFDDGPNAATTPQVLTTLEQEQITATFFLIGKNIAGNEGLVQRMTQDKFEIGNHTWSHMDMTALTPDQVKDELTKTQNAIVAAGGPLPTLFRPPYGAVDPQVVASAGLQMALWNEDPRDWQATDPAALQQAIISQAKPGGVVDLHDIHPITVSVLGPTIDALKAEGFQFVTVSQLQHSRYRPGRAPFYGYEAASYGLHP